MQAVRAMRVLTVTLATAMLLVGWNANPAPGSAGLVLVPGEPLAQVVVNPAAASNAIGQARSWDRVDSSYQYYYGADYRYDSGWYNARHVANPDSYVTYASDPYSTCPNEYYYMPDDGVYYCYSPDPVALNSNLQTSCPNQPYLYICPTGLR